MSKKSRELKEWIKYLHFKYSDGRNEAFYYLKQTYTPSSSDAHIFRKMLRMSFVDRIILFYTNNIMHYEQKAEYRGSSRIEIMLDYLWKKKEVAANLLGRIQDPTPGGLLIRVFHFRKYNPYSTSNPANGELLIKALRYRKYNPYQIGVVEESALALGKTDYIWAQTPLLKLYKASGNSTKLDENIICSLAMIGYWRVMDLIMPIYSDEQKRSDNKMDFLINLLDWTINKWIKFRRVRDKDPRITEVLLGLFIESPKAEFREKIIHLLIKINDETIVNPIMRIIQSPYVQGNSSLLTEMIKALGRLDHPSGMEAINTLLDHYLDGNKSTQLIEQVLLEANNDNVALPLLRIYLEANEQPCLKIVEKISTLKAISLPNEMILPVCNKLKTQLSANYKKERKNAAIALVKIAKQYPRSKIISSTEKSLITAWHSDGFTENHSDFISNEGGSPDCKHTRPTHVDMTHRGSHSDRGIGVSIDDF